MNAPMDADPASSSDGGPPAQKVGVAVTTSSTIVVPSDLLTRLLEKVDSLEARIAALSIHTQGAPPAAPSLPETLSATALSTLLNPPDLPADIRPFCSHFQLLFPASRPR